jgi:membrane protein
MALDGRNGDGRRGIVTLLRELAEGGTSLIRGEIHLAQAEIGEAAAGAGKGVALVAGGAVFALLGGLSLLAGGVLLIGDQWLPADRYWLAALIVLVVAGATAVWFAARGKELLSPSRPAPGATAATLTEDEEWLKQRLTSGETSS